MINLENEANDFVDKVNHVIPDDMDDNDQLYLIWFW